MNWEAIGAIGETLGATGVIVTLLYLTTQLRQNTRVLRAASVDSSTKIANDGRASLYADPELTAIYDKGLAGVESLTDIERIRFRLVMANALNSSWNAYAQSQLGGRQLWDAQKLTTGRLLKEPGGVWYWETYKGEFDLDFQSEVDQLVKRDS